MIYCTRLYPKELCKNIPYLDRIGFYSFSLEPFEHQPSGTCNMSKIRHKSIDLKISNMHLDTVRNKKLFVFAVSYNVLTIGNGISGLLFI